MSEYLDVTKSLRCKNIYDPLEIKPESDNESEVKYSKIHLIVPELYEVNDGNVELGEPDIIRVPYGELPIDLSTVDLCVGVTTVNNVELAVKYYSDNVIDQSGIMPVGGDLVIRSGEQISLNCEIENNIKLQMQNKFGLRDDEYDYLFNDYNLYAKADSLDDLTIGVKVRSKLNYDDILRRVDDRSCPHDLLPENIVALSQESIEKSITRDSFKKSIGACALLFMVTFDSTDFNEIITRLD